MLKDIYDFIKHLVAIAVLSSALYFILSGIFGALGR